MADQNDKMKFGLDISDFDTSQEILMRLFNELNENMKAVAVSSVNLSSKGKLISATFEAITNDGRAATATLKGLTDNVINFNAELDAFQSKNASGVTHLANPSSIAKVSNIQFGQSKDDLLNSKLAAIDKMIAEYDRLEKMEQQIANNDRKRFLEEQARTEQLFQLKERELDALDAKKAQQATIQQRRDKEMYDMAGREAAKSQAFIDKMNNAKVSPPKTAFDKLFNQAQAIAFGIVISQTFMKITTEITGAIDAAAKFEVRMSELRTISQDQQLSIGQWTQEIRGLIDQFGGNADDIAKGFYETLSNQIAKGAEATNFLRTSMQFAAATVTSTENAVNLLSSAIKGYHLNTSESQAAAASFFKLIDLGRVKADDIANSMGTVIPIASQLGIGLNDLNATLAVMTQQGVTADNAMTYMRNIMVSLLKPSGAMKETLHGWGVDSGEAALKTFGLVGVLSKLNDIVEQGGLTEIADNFKNIRSILGVSLLSGENINTFKSAVQDFKTAGSQYQEAVKIAFESPGKQLSIEFDKIKAMFLFDFGKPLVDSFVKITQSMGGLSNIVKTVAHAVEIGTIAWLAYKGAAFIGPAFEVAKMAIGALLTPVESLTVAWAALDAVIMANPIGIAVAGLAAFGTYLYITTKNSKQLYTEYYAEISAKSQENYDKELRQLGETTVAIKDAIDQRFQIYYKDVAAVRQMYDENTEQVKESFKIMNDSMRDVMARNVDYLKEQIAELKSKVREAEATIKQSFKFVADLTASQDKKTFRNKLADMSEPDQVKALQEKATETIAAAQNFLAAGNEDAYKATLKEAVDLLYEALDITRKTRKEAEGEAKTLAQLQRERLAAVKEEENIKRNIGYKALEAGLKAEKDELTFGRGLGGKHPINAIQDHNINIAEQNVKNSKAIDDAIAKYKALEEKIKGIDEKTKGKVQDTVSARQLEQSVLQQTETTIKSIMDMEEKRRADAKAAAEEAKKKIEEQKENVRNLTRLYKEAVEFDIFKGSKKSGLTPEKAEMRLKEFQQIKAKIEETQDKAGLDFGQTAGLIATLADKYKALQNEADRIIGVEQVDRLRKTFEDAQKNLKAYVDTLNAAQTAILGSGKTSVDKFFAFFKTFQGMRNGAEGGAEYGFDQRIEAASKIKDPGEQIKAIAALIPELEQLAKSVAKSDPIGVASLENAISQGSKLIELSNQYEKNSEELQDFKEIVLEVNSATAQSTFESVSSQVQSLDALKEQYKAAAEAAKEYQRSAKYIQDTTGDAVLPPAYHAHGGFARGSDTVPAMLTPGEFVMNARSSRMFYNQLVAMNSGIKPQYKAAGGPVTNVGDIHVTISAGKNTQGTLRNFGKELRRGIRRGIISFKP